MNKQFVKNKLKKKQNMSCTFSSNNLMIRPSVTPSEAKLLAEKLFGITVKDIKELSSYDDRNFLVEVLAANPKAIQDFLKDHRLPNPNKLVLKFMHSKYSYSKESFDAIEHAMQHFSKILGSKYMCPLPLPSRSGSLNFLADIKIPEDSEESQNAQIFLKQTSNENGCLSCIEYDGKKIYFMKHYARLLSYVPGDIFPNGDLDSNMLLQVGELAANVVKAFKELRIQALIEKEDMWDLKNLLLLKQPKFLLPIKDPVKSKQVETVFELFEKHVVSVIAELPLQTIHCDLNEQNILVSTRNGRRTITGLIDFGDINHSCRVFEISICMAYIVLLKPEDFIRVSGTVLAGYLERETLTKAEFSVVYYCVIARLAMSLVIGNYQYSLKDSENDYLLTTAKSGWSVLKHLLEYKDCTEKIVDLWLDCCSEEIRHMYRPLSVFTLYACRFLCLLNKN